MKKIRFVIGTRKSQNDFFTTTATGKSIPIFPLPFVELRLFPNNDIGLSTIYNIAIEESRNDPAILIFMHDDIHLLDYFWADQIVNSLNKFDVVGLAGNKRRVSKQPAWAFVDDKFTWDDRENLSGVVGHGTSFPPSNLNVFGPLYQEVKLLDGLMLAMYSETLINQEIRFDEIFDFHFYDLDFCRQIEQKKLKMGTWPLSVIHESAGNFGSDSWKSGYQKYLDKWKD
ncbi:MAG: glycosyltransferase [Sulfuriferula sp.]